MSLVAPPATQGEVYYPESDGEPMADNTRQFVWITVLFGNLAAWFRDVLDVFVCGNQFWYPVEGHPEIVNAPDVYVVFGRPKGHRSSWKQWEEGDVPMTVVFEVLSPTNTPKKMETKQAFYEEYGVEEYYIYDPELNTLEVWLRHGTVLLRVRAVQGHVSQRLGIRFDLSGPEMVVYFPDGKPFLSFEELKVAQEKAEQRADTAEQRADTAEQRADTAEQRADTAEQRADTAEQRADTAEQRADTAEQRADTAEQRADTAEQRLARLKELSRKARKGLASADELSELARLEDDASPPPT